MGKEINVSGVGGTQSTAKDTGYLDNFCRVYASEHTKANALCFAGIEDNCNIQRYSFMVHTDRDIVFSR